MSNRGETYKTVWEELNELRGDGVWEAKEVRRMLHTDMTTIHQICGTGIVTPQIDEQRRQIWFNLEQVLQTALAFVIWYQMGVYGDDRGECWVSAREELVDEFCRLGGNDRDFVFDDLRVQEAIMMVGRGLGGE